MHRHDRGEREGAKQPERFDARRAAGLEDPARFAYLPAEEIARMLDVPRDGTLVDFGAGTGAYARAIARLRPDAAIFALDELPPMLVFLRERLIADPAPGVSPVLAGTPEAEALRGRADRVLALNVLHELGDAALDELARLLKPDGRALFIDWNADAVERPIGPPKEHVYTPAEVRKRLEARGWRAGTERLFNYHYAFSASLPAR